MVALEVVEPFDEAEPDPPEDGGEALLLPVEFYASRQVLADIRAYAHRRGCAADVVLYGVLARLSGMVPPECRVNSPVGKAMGASLNLFVAAVGDSGTGKSTGSGVAADMYRVPADVDFGDNLPLGSGEGIAEAFMGMVEEDTGEVHKSGALKGEPKTVKVRDQVRRNAYLFVDEGEAFNKMKERSGATLGAAIRTGWYGGTLGQQNADQQRNRLVPEGNYALGMLIGFQAGTVMPLLVDDDAGTPQRFVYCSTIDPTIPRECPADVPLPEPTTFAPYAVRLNLAGPIRQEVWARHNARQRGELVVPRLDSHGDLTRIKLAGLLCLLDERSMVTEDDWALSAIMWETSCRVRDHFRHVADIEAAKAQIARTEQRANSELHMERARIQARNEVDPRLERIAANIVKSVCVKGDRTIAAARRRLQEPDRMYVVEAAEYAAEQGWIVLAEGGAAEPGASRPAS